MSVASNYRRKTFPHLGLYLIHIRSVTVRAWTEPARQRLSLDDLNGFPSVTKNIYFLSSWHSPPQPPDTIDFFLRFSLPSCTRSLLVLLRRSRVSESESASVPARDKNRQHLFYYTHLLCLYMSLCVCVCLIECQDHCYVGRCGCFF